MPYETYLPQDVTKHAQSSLGANEVHPHTAREATLDGRPTDRTVLQHEARFRFPCFLHRRQGMLGKG